MSDKQIDSDLIEFRMVMIDAESARILTLSTGAGRLLPREFVPPFTRIAEMLNEAVERHYGLRTIQLALLPPAQDQSYCAVHEIVGDQGHESGKLSLTRLEEIALRELSREEETLVLGIIKGKGSKLGRFARLGWIDELVANLGVDRKRRPPLMIQQLNQGIDFCLLSLTDAKGHKIWFKAIGKPNTHEYALTAELTRRFPQYLPKTIATIPEWNGWIMEDVKGVPLDESCDVEQCAQALTALAEMQTECVGDTAFLFALGAKDWACDRIAGLSEAFFAEAAYAMRAQTSTKTRPLSRGELDKLKSETKSLLGEFTNRGIPKTLMHGDIGHGNIMASPRGPVFLDWAETYIGHPFFCAEHLLADLVRSSPLVAENRAALRRHYAKYWADYVRPAELERVTLHAPAIAAFAYAVIAWDANRSRPDPTLAWPLLRSMLRRTKHELEQASEVVA